MKPRFAGTQFEDIVRFLKQWTRGLFLTRDIIDITPAAVAAWTISEETFTVARLSTNETVFVEYTGAQTAGIGLVSARVSAANTLAISFINSTAGSLTPASGDYRLIRMEP